MENQKNMPSCQIGKSTHFWKINIFTKTVVFIICVPESLNMRSEWGNIKECNIHARFYIYADMVAKRGIHSCFVQIPNSIVHNFLLCTKMHHLDIILFCSNMNSSYLLILLLRWRVTDSLSIVYILPSKSPNGILFIKMVFSN